MFEIFVALFGGIFYGKKYANDKGKSRAYDSDQKRILSKRDVLIAKYAADAELTMWAKEYIESGAHFDDICASFANDFGRVFGDDWKKKLEIPRKQRVDYKSFVPEQHAYWVYQLLLARKGKIDRWYMTQGFIVSSIQNKDRDVKFAQCIEKELLNAGVQDVYLVLELDHLAGTRYRNRDEVARGSIKPEVFCNYPSCRLW